MREKILIIDYGSQYSQLIARRIREMEVYCEITSRVDVSKIGNDVKGIIFSGGPASVYEENSPSIDKKIFSLNIPILGICYGMQLITYLNGGMVEKSDKREFGKATLEIIEQENPLFKGVPKESLVWMSHGDHITKMAQGFRTIAKTSSSNAAVCNDDKVYALQFHPEVLHSQYGKNMIENFVFDICKIEKNWKMGDVIKEKIEDIKKKTNGQKVLLGLSGGVDSSVAALLINKAIGDKLVCVFVDTGLLRKDEAIKVKKQYEGIDGFNIVFVDARKRFLEKLKGVVEPEEKRKIIGKEFIEVFNEQAKKLQEEKEIKFLAQGTIYPDVIESASEDGLSHTIKSHHNVGGLPKDCKFELIEPLRNLFKDEVRKLGKNLGLHDELIKRHPFPGPGLGIRVIEEVTEEKVRLLQEADNIFIEELIKNGLYDKVSQAFVVLLPVKTVGVMGDVRTYEYVVAIRSVNTIDFMTATFSRLPYEFLEIVSNRIVNEVRGVNRVVYDISSKPAATIEWE